MKQPLTLLVACLLLVIAATGYGLWERHVGAQQALARARADSLLTASLFKQDSILAHDSLLGRQADSAQNALRRVLGALGAQKRALASKTDSLAKIALSFDSLVPRDTVVALVGAFQRERATDSATISTLAADTLLLVGRIAQQDSTIRGLTGQLAVARAGWAQALKPQTPGLFDKALRLGEAILAVRGGVAFALGK